MPSDYTPKTFTTKFTAGDATQISQQLNEEEEINVTQAAQITALQTGAVQGVIVSTGTETRPSSNVVLWVGGTTQPTHIGADDIWLQSNDRVPYGIPFNAGEYHRLNDTSESALFTMTANEVIGAVFIAGRTATLTQLGLKITSAGSAGSVIRFGLYELPSGLTATLIADFGTAVGTSTGVVTKSGTAALVAGKKYWAVAVSQGSPGTPPSVRQMSTEAMLSARTGIGSATADHAYSIWINPAMFGVSGALASGSISISGDAAPALIGLCAT